MAVSALLLCVIGFLLSVASLSILSGGGRMAIVLIGIIMFLVGAIGFMNRAYLKNLFWGKDRLLLLAGKFLVVREEFGVSARAQFVQIHSLPLSFNCDALRIEAIQNPVQSIRYRKHESEQSRHTDHLR